MSPDVGSAALSSVSPSAACATIILNRVVLPTPLGPMTPTMPLRGSVKLRSSIRTRSSNALVRPLGLDDQASPGAGPAGSGSPRSRACGSSPPRLAISSYRSRRARLLVCRALALERTHSSSSVRRRLQLRVLRPLDLQARGLGLEVGGVVALVGVGAATVELQDPLGHVLQEVPVVGDRHDRARVLLQVLLEPLHALGVEVVRGLVEQQQVGLLQQQLAQGHAAALPAGQHRHVGVSGRAAQRVHRLLELGVEIPGVQVVDLLLQHAHLGHERVEVRVRIGHQLGDLVVPVDQRLGLGDPLLDVAQHGLGLVELRLLGTGSRRCSPALSVASPFETWSSPAMILSRLDLPAPLGPTTPILAPGRNDRVTLSRTTLSPCALRALRSV